MTNTGYTDSGDETRRIPHYWDGRDWRAYPRSSITLGAPWDQRTYYELHTLYPVPPGYRIEIIRVTMPALGEQEKEWGRWVPINRP